MKTRAAFFLVLLISAFAQLLIAAEPVDVSLVQLIANPKDYDGKIVRVVGFVSLEFEGTAVYLHSDDHKYFINRNGLWLQVPKEIRARKGEFDQKYVVIQGTFNAQAKGHRDMWSGSIEKISGFELPMSRE